MASEEIATLLNEYAARCANGKPFTDEEYAEDKAKMDDYAEFCAYLAERAAMDEDDYFFD